MLSLSGGPSFLRGCRRRRWRQLDVPVRWGGVDARLAVDRVDDDQGLLDPEGSVGLEVVVGGADLSRLSRTRLRAGTVTSFQRSPTPISARMMRKPRGSLVSESPRLARSASAAIAWRSAAFFFEIALIALSRSSEILAASWSWRRCRTARSAFRARPGRCLAAACKEGVCGGSVVSMSVRCGLSRRSATAGPT